MKNKLLPLIFAFLAVTSVNAQKCGTYEGSYEEQKQKFPSFYQNLESINADLEADYKSALSEMKHLKTENGKKIIPVVVHVIHDMGGENISDASIQNALDILNANINGDASNFLAKTPDIFASVRGDLNVEFRLAKIDPIGNPTSGIIRVRSELTTDPEPRDAVKALSYWNSLQYFNIWTLKKFLAQEDGNTLLGYAQFPWQVSDNFPPSMSTDGVVLLASQMVSGGTLTHEVGHWLGLRHVWGDADCGDDNVSDTPPAKEPNFGINLSDFPWHVGNIGIGSGCLADSLNPAGEMFVNYMDYSNDADVTMFTKGQNAVMNETLEGIYDAETNETGIGYREYMWSADNIAATGVSDGHLTPTCSQKAVFFEHRTSSTNMCEGSEVWLSSNSKSFDNLISISWDLGDGTVTPGSYQNQLGYYYMHTYNNADVYDVSLTIEYNETTEARAASLSDLDLTNASSDTAILTTIIVQGTESELNNLGASNITLHIDEEGYSLDSYWKNNQFTVDSLVGVFNIDTFQVEVYEDTIIVYLDGGGNISTPDSVLVIDDGDSLYIYIDGGNLTAQDLVLLETPAINTADSSTIFTTEFIVDYLDSIVDYNFYYDTTVINILTYIDSTYLNSTDSLLLNSADSSWSIDGLLNSSDSITIYFAQFNIDTIITISINTDIVSLSPSDSLMFNDADSVWNVNAFVGWVDTVRTLYGKHYYTKYNGYYPDTLFYRGELEKVTYVAYYNNTCTTTTVKENFISVNPILSIDTAGSYTYSFEDVADLSEDWHIITSAADVVWNFNFTQNSSWEWVDGVAVSGNACIMIDKDNLAMGSHELISKAYDLSTLSDPAIKFSWSGAAVNNSPVNEINVYYSDNCGEDWKDLSSLTNIQVANAGLYTTNFKPEVNEWNDIIMTKPQLKDDNIMFKFDYVINGNSNNFYLDNIMIGEELDLMIVEDTSSARLSIYPNPTDGKTFIELNNLAHKELDVKLVNILGADIMHLYSGKIADNYYMINNIDLSHLETGIYFVKVVADGNIIMTDKLILK